MPVLGRYWERKWVASGSFMKCSCTFREASTRPGQPAASSRVKPHHQDVTGALATFSPCFPNPEESVRPQSRGESRTLSKTVPAWPLPTVLLLCFPPPLVGTPGTRGLCLMMLRNRNVSIRSEDEKFCLCPQFPDASRETLHSLFLIVSSLHPLNLEPTHPTYTRFSDGFTWKH